MQTLHGNRFTNTTKGDNYINPKLFYFHMYVFSSEMMSLSCAQKEITKCNVLALRILRVREITILCASSKSERDHYSLCYGINRESKLASLEPFDITKQLPQDVMHVLLEGIAPIHLGLLLKNILVDNPVCTLK